jgi:ribosomal protein S18 acetylase RimI-like enzyme
MTDRFVFRVNAASAEEVTRHLRRCDFGFVPILSSRVDIDSYAVKIVDDAMRFEAWIASDLIGLLAVYVNEKADRTAFITNVSVVKEWQGMGIALGLLRRCICYASVIGFGKIELEVLERNTSAVKLYEKLGFFWREPRCGRMVMFIENIVGLESKLY